MKTSLEADFFPGTFGVNSPALENGGPLSG
jgi:hypothetical protein